MPICPTLSIALLNPATAGYMLGGTGESLFAPTVKGNNHEST
jgi:hypothetical protein